MDVRDSSAGGCVVMEVQGRVDSSSAPELGEKLLQKFAAQEQRLVLDLSGTPYLSSAGLRVLLRAAEQVEQTHGRLVLHGLNSRVEEVFDISGFADMFTICKTREEALALVAA